MQEVLHIIDRAYQHLYQSSGYWLLALVLLAWACRRLKWWPQLHGWNAYVVPAILVLLGISVWEITNVAAGQTLTKAFTDIGSWAVGLTATIIGVRKLFPVLSRIETEIKVKHYITKDNLQQYKAE
jgi:chromate transport protein ChrA